MSSAIPASASAGDKVWTPRCSSRERASSSAMPADHGPKLTLIAGNTLLTQPPGQPVEEGVGRAVGGLAEAAPHRGDRGSVRKKSSCRSAVASLKFQAPQTFPANTRSTSASSRVRSGVVPISPAAWTMPASGGSSACTVANRRATSCGLATSAAITRKSQPDALRYRVDALLRRHRWVSADWSAPAAGRRARPDIRRSPVRSNPARRSPDTLRQHRSASGVATGSPARRVSRGT